VNYVTVGQYFNSAEADVNAARLRAAGFNVLVHGENAGRVTASLMSTGGVRLQVPADQEAAAREFLANGEGAPEEAP
jgi:hypothetical protein